MNSPAFRQKSSHWDHNSFLAYCIVLFWGSASVYLLTLSYWNTYDNLYSLNSAMQGNRGFRPPHLLHDQLIRLTIWISTLSFPALDPIVFVRSTQALWTAGTVTLLAIVLRGIGCSPVAISVGSLLCATNGAVWFNSSHIMSYAPTYFFTLLTTYTFINWIRSRSIKWVAALGASLAAVTWMHQAGCFLGIPILIGAAMSRDKRVFLITLFATALSGLMVFLSYLVVAMFLGNHEPYAIYRWIAKYPSHPNWGSAVHMLDLHRAATGLSGAFLGYSTASPTGIRSFLLGWTSMTLLLIVLIFTDRAKRTDPVLIFLMIQAWGYMGFAIYWVPDFSWTYGFGVLAWIIIWSTVAGGIGLDGWRHRLLSTLYIALSCWLAGIQVVYGMVGVRRDSVPERDEESLFASMALKASKPGDVFILNSYFAGFMEPYERRWKMWHITLIESNATYFQERSARRYAPSQKQPACSFVLKLFLSATKSHSTHFLMCSLRRSSSAKALVEMQHAFERNMIMSLHSYLPIALLLASFVSPMIHYSRHLKTTS